MFYREAGQFKTSYAADMAVFPIRQDRWFVAALLVVAFVGLPLFASDYLFRAILIPFLILSLAAIGLNLLVASVRFQRVILAPKRHDHRIRAVPGHYG